MTITEGGTKAEEEEIPDLDEEVPDLDAKPSGEDSDSDDIPDIEEFDESNLITEVSFGCLKYFNCIRCMYFDN